MYIMKRLIDYCSPPLLELPPLRTFQNTVTYFARVFSCKNHKVYAKENSRAD